MRRMTGQLLLILYSFLFLLLSPADLNFVVVNLSIPSSYL